MSTLLAPRPPVHSEVRDDCEPFISPEDVSFKPGPIDDAWDLGYRLGRAGQSARYPDRAVFNRRARHAFNTGYRQGQRARDVAIARELGRASGEIGSPLSEPPSGYSRAEKAAYREGYDEGIAVYEGELAWDAWLDEQAEERDALAFGRHEITDFDMWPPGCCS